MASETTTKFKVDISELKKGIQDANRQIKLANAEFKAAAAGMDDWQHSADGLTAKIASTEKVLKAQRTILDDYKKQLALIVTQYGESSKEADEMRIKIANQEAAVKNTEKSLSNYRQKLEEVENGEKQTTKAADDLDKSLAETKEETKKTGESFTVFKGILADLVASGIKAAVSALKDFASAAKDAFASFDEGRDTLIAKTGATGEAAADLMDVYKNVSTSVVGDFDEMGAAVGELNTRFGLSGKELEKLSAKFLKFSKLNGTDVSSSVDDVQKAMSAFGLSSDKAGDVLDALNLVAQQTGVNVSTLTKGLVQNGTAFQELGLSVEQAAALMGQMEKSGANSETVMNGLRKALKTATKDGTSLSDALAELEKSIVSGKDSTTGLQSAYDAFGKSGDQIYGALKNGTLSFKAITLAADDYKGSVDATYEATQDASDKIKLAMQGVKLSVGETVNDVLTKYQPDIEKAIETVSSVVKSAISWIAEKAPPAIEKVKGVFDKIAPVIQTVFGWIVDHKTELIAALAGIGAAIIAWNIANVVSGVVALVSALKAMGAASAFAAAKQWLLNSALLANPIGLIVAAIAGLVAAFVVLWKKSEKFRNFWIVLWDKIKSAVKPVIEWVTTAFEKIWEKAKPVFEKVRDVATSAFKDISEVFLAAWGAIKAAWDLVYPYFEAIWNNIKSVFEQVAPVLKSYFEAAWQLIKLVWDVAVKYFSMIWENIKVVFSAVKNTLSGFFIAAWEGIKFIWDTVTGYFKMIWDNIKLIFSAVKAVLSGDFKGAWDAVKGIWDNANGYFSGVWDGVKNVFAKVKDYFATAFSEAWKAIKGVFSNVGEFFGGIWDTIKERFTSIGTKIGEAVGGAFKLAINAALATVEKGINFVPDAINKAIDLINALPGVEIQKIPNITLPRLENGGILKRGQIGLLEGNGAEAVVPLDKNRAWISEVASQLRRSLGDEGIIGGVSGRRAGGTVYNFTQYNNSPKALSRLEIYRQSKNLLSGVKAV